MIVSKFCVKNSKTLHHDESCHLQVYALKNDSLVMRFRLKFLDSGCYFSLIKHNISKIVVNIIDLRKYQKQDN